MSPLKAPKSVTETWAWFDGEILPAADIQVGIMTHGLHYGTGAFEGIRAYASPDDKQGFVFRLQDHMRRLLESTKIIGLPVKYSIDQLCEAALEVCRKNDLRECYIRPLIYIGQGPLGLNPGNDFPVHVAIVTWKWGKYLGEDGVNKGIRVKTSSYVRPHVNSVMTKGKITGQYTTSVMAKMEAIRDGYDEGLFLDPDGFLAEGTGENIFVVRDGQIKTTPLTAVLNGITRQSVMTYFESKGQPVSEARFSRDEIYCADEIFLCGTAAEITPVREIDGRLVGDGSPGPVTCLVRDEYQKLVRGEIAEFEQWLSPIVKG